VGNETESSKLVAPREHLVRALEADLVGPFDLNPASQEVLHLPPSRWYLAGFLAPLAGRDPEDPTSDEELAAGSDEEEEETAGSEPEPKQKNRLPASMGLSVLLPPGKGDTIRATVSFADYVAEEREVEGGKRARRVWRRVVRSPIQVELPLDPRKIAEGTVLPDTGGIRLTGKLAPADAPGLEPGTRALSLFVVNHRPVGEKGRQDEQFIFQVGLEAEYERGLVPRPNIRDEDSDEWDERVSDLQFRNCFEYAVGHGVSVEIPPHEGPVKLVRTAWIPRADVPRVETRGMETVVTAMEDLSAYDDGQTLGRGLRPLIEAYGEWIRSQRAINAGVSSRKETRDQLMHDAERARNRILEGIELLEKDAQAFEAFRLANRAMALAVRHRNPERYDRGEKPRWRLFQLAFILCNLPSITNEQHEDRDNVELIFFPTGGGKTEAYLGVIALTLVLRRLRGVGRPDQGLGVAVLLRYTLRLLTLDQLSRAATLICALERLRQEDPAKLGDVRFSVAVWVGRTATANTMEQAARSITDYKNNPSQKASSPFPLTNCPWCRTELTRDSLTLAPNFTNPTEVVVGCVNIKCEFRAAKNPEGLPVLFVDEQIYRELPCFIVATVDKFAMLPWRGETGMLFGRVHSRDGRRFYGPLDPAVKGAHSLPGRVRPPELIVQDELHLISGPLGTMVGLYETAIETLSTKTEGEHLVRPKILASTATVRRAREQLQALFGRNRFSVFPPPGVDDNETFFARVHRTSPSRLYVGVAAPGRAMKGILLRTYVTLLGAASKVYDPKAGADQTADTYMTLVGYFNSLRELGGMRRLVEDEVRSRTSDLESKRPVDFSGDHPWFRNRLIQMEPVELTSREPTGKVTEAKARLAKPWAEKDHVDVLLASNMISVGVDIDRLGLMVVAGQPKTTSEYIQASSRVGRQARWPGLVVTCFNVHKPRDRSHYERFTTYHQSFYRFVEVTSLTPFSGPALDRGLAGTLVAMVRLLEEAMTPPGAASDVSAHRDLGERAVRTVAERGARQPTVDGGRYERVLQSLIDRGRNLLDSWESLTEQARRAASRLAYSPFDKDRTAGKPLLFSGSEEHQPAEGTEEAKWRAPTSMRDVEPTVHLWLERSRLGGKS